ncbi:P-loop containing nucleoside triphosphate hydrolase protein [Rhizoclosmatium globosum]|uniref:p-loop containing nucleoside triphosphate hydrolase protein n=1 Tax=Rhizoclosmatium globosum TaxID=329046 RepID=A0A1Y2CKA1_9FUNG|nr:P-loop containing nucleoside triphosphate hydrolase protein [Rhizoclosmatium globosum]|eukprot:ORY47443.1 P-loop containing nucleoside triphosphate hydrolase protein [Rhizoclosmatium globosum]
MATAANCELASPDSVISATIFNGLELDMNSPKKEEGEEGNENTEKPVDEETDQPPEPSSRRATIKVANTFEKGTFEGLLAGKEIDSQKFLEGYKTLCSSNDAQHKGIVIDGLPFTSPWNQLETEATDVSTPTYKYKDLETLASILDSKPHNFRLVLVDLMMGHVDLKERRGRQWIDPVTGLLYPGGQVEYSKRRRAEGWVEGLDAEMEAVLVDEDKTWNFDVEDQKKKKPVGEDGEEEEEPQEEEEAEEGDDGEEGDDEEGSKKKKPKIPENKSRFNLSNKNVWPILPKEILDRLLKRPEDMPDLIDREFEAYEARQSEIAKLKAKYFDELHTIKLDASEHPDILLKCAMNKLGTLGFNLLERTPMSKRLEIAPGTFTGMTQQDIYTYLNALELETNEPPREESSWGRFCPVQFYETGTLVHSGFENPISYRGCFFFLSDQESMEKFQANPDKYLETPPTLKGAKLCVLGGPFTGKTAQSKMLAKIYNLKYISVDEMLDEWDHDPNQRELKKRVPMYAEIVKRCKKGLSIAPEMMIELIKMALKDQPSADLTRKSGTKDPSGWVIDGFPRTLDEARALVQAGLAPEYIVLLKNDINEERVRMRSKAQLADSKSGKPWVQKPKTVDLTPHPPSQPKPNGSHTRLASNSRLSSSHRLSSVHRLVTPGGRFKSPPKKTPPRGHGRATVSQHRTSISQRRPSNLPPPTSLIEKKKTFDEYEMPAMPILMFPYFDNLFNGFREELAEIVKLLELKTKIVETGAEQSIPTILAIIQTAIDPFLPKAQELTEKQLQELPAILEMGSTKDYCPFALRQVNILQKGNPNIAVKYMGQVYYLCSDEARYAFLMEPHNFVSTQHLMVPPPPRFFFLGPTGAGKSVCMKALEKWGAPIVRFQDYVFEFAATAEQSVKEEIEYMMKENAGLLSPIIVEDIITSLFKKEPYASKGFLLEGFPRTKVEAEVVVKHNLYVDAVVVLRIDAEVAAHRMMSERKKELKAKRDAAKKTYQSVKSDKNFTALESVLKEIKNLEEHESEILDTFLDIVDKDNMRIGDATSTFESSWTVPIIEIDCNKCIRPVLGSLKRNCTQFFENRRSLLCNAIKIEYRDAELLMRLGVKNYSKFGNLCPVSLKRNSSVLRRLTGTKPVLYRDCIYYLRNEENRDEFIANIYEYINQPPPQTVVRPQICIVGRPKAGKSVAAERIAKEYDMVYLTISIIINSILQGKEHLQLAYKIQETLTSGLELPDEIVNEAVLLVTSRAVCQVRGWVLDGYPQTIEQAKALEKMGLVPHVVFNLNISEEDMFSRADYDLKMDIKLKTPHLNYPSIMQTRNDIYTTNLSPLKALYQVKYANWMEIDGTKSKWFLKEAIAHHLESETKRRQNYTDLKTKGLAAPLNDISISVEFVEHHLSKFGEYCGVRLLNEGELVRGPAPSTKFTAEYQGRFYRMAGEDELRIFLQNPAKYAYGPELPETLPQRRDASALVFPRQLELQGYCPVTFGDGPPGFESILPGDPNLIVEYEGKLYSFTTEETLEKFMKTPWDYVNLELPKKLPPKLVNINIGQLPLIGYLEQSVARALMDSLTDVGKFRPKYPYKSLTKSAADYVGLFLQATNPKAKEWMQEAKAKELGKFREHCDLLYDIAELSRGADSNFAFIPKEERPLGLDEKLNRFFALKS